MLLRSSCFELLILATESVSKYPDATTSTSEVHINNMYIKYTYVDVAILLICQVLGAILLRVTIPLIKVALSLEFGSSIGFLHWSGNCLAILEVSLLSLAFLETSGLD